MVKSQPQDLPAKKLNYRKIKSFSPTLKVTTMVYVLTLFNLEMFITSSLSLKTTTLLKFYILA